MQVILRATRIGLRNSTTRLPFRYGKACLTRCPQLVLEATVEAAGRTQAGYAGDCLPPGWFDKTPGKSYRRQVAEQLEAVALGEACWAESARNPVAVFHAALDALECTQAGARARGLTSLLASFGASLVERAVIDAVCRLAGVSVFAALREGILGIEPGRVHPELVGVPVRAWLPESPSASIWVRHTVGLADPLTGSDRDPGEQVGDGLPHTLEEVLERTGIRYLKVKLSNRLETDLERLVRIARLVERHRGRDYRLTLDGNEQYGTAEALESLIEALEREPELTVLRENVLALEQPLERAVALEPAAEAIVRRVGAWRPVIFDESDGTLDAYRQGVELGYRGVSHKNCKGPLKSVLNAGLAWWRNQRLGSGHDVITGEDLCSVGIVPVQADLALAAALGITHVERNGHHYHPGLSYLPEAQREAALAAHPDFYARTGSIVGPCVREGRFAIGSFQAPGFGFAVQPRLEDWETQDNWDFGSLGLDEEA